MNNIVLFGFMGCGKSTVGALLAQKSGRPLFGYRRVSGTKIWTHHPADFCNGRRRGLSADGAAGLPGIGRADRAGSVLRRRHRAEWGERRPSGPKRDNGVFGRAFYGAATTGFGRATDRWYKKTAKRKYSGFLSFGARYTCPGHR